LRQAKMGLIDTILHFRLIVLWCRDCPHLAWEPSMPLLTHWSLDGNDLVLPFP
jgi:hypothetical protein